MLIKGKKIAREYRVVEIPRKDGPVSVRVVSMPLGLQRDFEAICPQPMPPFTVNIKTNERKEDWGNPEFLKQSADWRDLQEYYQLYVCLSEDPEVVFENIPKDESSMKALRQEMRDSGLSQGDRAIIMHATLAASNITDEILEKAKKSF